MHVSQKIWLPAPVPPLRAQQVSVVVCWLGAVPVVATKFTIRARRHYLGTVGGAFLIPARNLGVGGLRLVLEGAAMRASES